MMNEKEIIRQTTIKRNIANINNQFYDEYSNIIDRLINGTISKGEILKILDQYTLAIAPFIGDMFRKNYTINPSIKNKINTEKTIRTSLSNYEKKISDITLSKIKNFSTSDIDVNTYNELRNKGTSIVEALSITDKGQTNHAIVSEKLFQNSIDNLVSQMEADSDFEYNRNKLDGDGNPLYTTKRWLSSNLENTRHMEMEGTVIPINEEFVVINDFTGEIDYMMYPRDSNGSPANTYNCGCGISYGNEYYDLIDGTDFKYI